MFPLMDKKLSDYGYIMMLLDKITCGLGTCHGNSFYELVDIHHAASSDIEDLVKISFARK